jgi:hypothetical protein
VIDLQGGNEQTISMKLPTLKDDGSFETTRTITGRQAGGFSVIATLVVFDVCMQDDTNGNSIVVSSETGDYMFCQSQKGIGGANPMSLTTVGSFSGEPLLQKGFADDWTSVLTVRHTASDRRVLINLSAGFSGNAVVETSTPKRNFFITDRDIRNDTCACE